MSTLICKLKSLPAWFFVSAGILKIILFFVGLLWTTHCYFLLPLLPSIIITIGGTIIIESMLLLITMILGGDL